MLIDMTTVWETMNTIGQYEVPVKHFYSNRIGPFSVVLKASYVFVYNKEQKKLLVLLKYTICLPHIFARLIETLCPHIIVAVIMNITVKTL